MHTADLIRWAAAAALSANDARLVAIAAELRAVFDRSEHLSATLPTGEDSPEWDGLIARFEPLEDEVAALPAAGLPVAAFSAVPQADPFTGYGAEVLALHGTTNALPPGTADAVLNALMDRWGEIDAQAMSGRPTTFAGAAAALEHARRESVQFHIEPREDGGSELDPGDKLILHLIDGAIALLHRSADGCAA